jgi:hypothetical protein
MFSFQLLFGLPSGHFPTGLYILKMNLSQLLPPPIVTIYHPNIHLNIILPSSFRSSKGMFSNRVLYTENEPEPVPPTFDTQPNFNVVFPFPSLSSKLPLSKKFLQIMKLCRHINVILVLAVLNYHVLISDNRSGALLLFASYLQHLVSEVRRQARTKDI